MTRGNLYAPKAQCVLRLCLIMLAVSLFLLPAFAAGAGNERVRVGYYENEVFPEGAQAGAVKTGYA